MSEPLYDEEMLRRVALLAARLQLEREKQLLQPGQKLTAAEMDVIGEEMGLDPALMRQALGYVEAREEAEARAKQGRRRQWILAGVAAGLFLVAGGIFAFKVFLSGALQSLKPFGSIPQINVTLKREGEPSLELVMEPSPVANGREASQPPSAAPSPITGEGTTSAGVAAMDSAAAQRYLDWIKRAEGERVKLALRLVTHGQRMRAALGGSEDQTRPLTDASVKDLLEFRSAVEQVHSEVPDPCRSAYYAYRSAVQKDTREAEGLANAFFRWKDSDARKYGYDATRSILQRYERPALELEAFLKAGNITSDARIAVREDACLLRSLNFGMGNF